jgi:hypothetical protein
MEEIMKGYRVYIAINGQDIKIGSIIQDAIIENHEIVNTWNWVCMGAGKQRRGRGAFKTIQDAKKAFLKVCGFSIENLKFIQIEEKVTA